MTETDAIPAEIPHDPLADVPKPRRSYVLLAGGFLGVAGCLIGLLTLVTVCAGFDKMLRAGAIAAGCGAVGIVISIVGGLLDKKRIEEETHVLQAIFVNGIAILGGVLQYAVSQGWTPGAK